MQQVRQNRTRLFIGLGALATALVLPPAQAEMPPPQRIPVQVLEEAPWVDGALDDWPDAWVKVPVDSAMEEESRNRMGAAIVEVQFAQVGDELYVATRWPDPTESRTYKPWVWKDYAKRYRRGKQQDDMFALRFDLGGDFRTCMLADADYEVDVWLWSAGRSDREEYATDMWHRITTDLLMNAAEYELDDGTVVYIDKEADAGEPGYENTRPRRREYQGDSLPGVAFPGPPSGSIGDVWAKGRWQDGYWQLEMSRALETEDDKDVSFRGRETLRAQIAVFDQSDAEHKSVSGQLDLVFGP